MNTKRNPVGWFEIYVQDMGRAKAFYEKTFNQTLEEIPSPGIEMWAFPGECDGGGATGALAKMEGKDSGGGGTIVYFSCEDCGETAKAALAAGGRMQLEKMSIGEYGFISLVYDTEGNMIGLHSMQ
ncbi:VOC family protein [Haloferula chungangensis]|uniref:VOC family protein n=1 Tax=Haloferula chungangensis TaxID=1048331 RepID=A0ABW2L825_9BACT